MPSESDRIISLVKEKLGTVIPTNVDGLVLAALYFGGELTYSQLEAVVWGFKAELGIEDSFRFPPVVGRLSNQGYISKKQVKEIGFWSITAKAKAKLEAGLSDSQESEPSALRSLFPEYHPFTALIRSDVTILWPPDLVVGGTISLLFALPPEAVSQILLVEQTGDPDLQAGWAPLPLWHDTLMQFFAPPNQGERRVFQLQGVRGLRLTLATEDSTRARQVVLEIPEGWNPYLSSND